MVLLGQGRLANVVLMLLALLALVSIAVGQHEAPAEGGPPITYVREP